MGEQSLQSLLKMSRGIDAFTRWDGQTSRLAHSGRGGGVRHQRDRAQGSGHLVGFLARAAMGAVQHRLPAVSPWTLLDDEHIRIDIVNNLLPKPVRNVIDIIGHAFFLLPLTIVMIITGIPFFLRSFEINEQSGNAGGLPQWPAKSLIMIGFAFLLVQGVSELIKRIAIMRGLDTGSARVPGTRHRSRGRAPRRGDREELSARRGRGPLDGSVSHRQHGADYVRVAGGRAAAGLSGSIFAWRGWTDLCPDRHRARRIPARLSAGAARANLWRDEQRHAAGDSLLYLHGVGTRTIGHGRRSARHRSGSCSAPYAADLPMPWCLSARCSRPPPAWSRLR